MRYECGILLICLERVLRAGMDSRDINLPEAAPDKNGGEMKMVKNLPEAAPHKNGAEMKNGEKPCHVYFIENVNIILILHILLDKLLTRIEPEAVVLIDY